MNQPLSEQTIPLQRRSFLASIWVVPAVVLLILGGILSWVTYDKYQQAHEAEFRLLEAHARYAEVQVGAALRDAAQLLDTIASERLESIEEKTPREFEASLTYYGNKHPELLALFVTDRSGRVVSATDAALVGRDVSKMGFFAAHRNPLSLSEMAVSRPDASLLGVNAALLTLTIDNDDDDGEFVGVVGAAINFGFFQKALEPVNPADSASVSVLVNNDGDLLYRRYDPEKFFGRNVARDSQVLREHLAAATPVNRSIGPSAVDGKPRLFVTRRIENTAINAILSRAQSEVLANWQRDLLIRGLIFLFTAAVMLFLARVAHQRQAQLLASSEALREAKETAETANAAKSHFLAAASHDLRQPLHALALLVAVLKRRHSDEASMKVIRPIEESTQALKELLDALLDISRLDAGVVVPQKQAIAVNALLGRLESEFAVQADARHLKFRVRRAPSTAVHTDPTLLMEMLRNLMSNACRHTRRGGILLGCRLRRDRLVIQVWDTGKGIPEEELDKIFREYYQIDNSERDRHKGLGLGLSIVERLARLLGHPVRVRSRVGRGSLFEVSVPLSDTPPAEPKAPAAEAAPPSVVISILIIDDDNAVLQGTSMLLEELGYHPVVAQSAADAVQKIGGHAPDLILADYRLEGEHTGIEAINMVRSHLGIFVPGILVSGDILPERLREANLSGFRLLHKPVNPEELDEQIKGLVKGRMKGEGGC